MAKQSGKSSKGKDGGKAAPKSIRGSKLSSLRDDINQLCYPPELRIGRPLRPISARPLELLPAKIPPNVPEPVQQESPPSALAEVATCLWYIKTKHFKREWQNDDTADDDPRTRRTLGRLNKGADALKKCGLEVTDPTGKRYPTGGEAMMKPLDFVPTQGLTYEKVTEAVLPLVYLHGRLIQRAEVFVAVPPAAEEKRDTAPVPPEGSTAEAAVDAPTGPTSAEGMGTVSVEAPQAASTEQPDPAAACVADGGPAEPSTESISASGASENAQQKMTLTTNATNDTASVETGEQA